MIGDAYIELGRYRRGFQGIRHDEPAPPEPLLLRAHLLRPRADRPHDRRDQGDEARDRRRLRRRRADRLDTRPARQALLRPRADRRRRARVPLRARGSSPTTPTASTRCRRRSPRAARYGRAIAAERQAVDAIPLPQYVAALGDLYRVTGRPVLARRQYALIGAIERLLHANGVKTDLEIALFQADHGIALRHALQRARVARAERPSIDGDDVLGWALARNGRCAEALPHSRRRPPARHAGRAEVLPPRDASSAASGTTRSRRRGSGRALALNPHFSLLWAPAAKRWAA